MATEYQNNEAPQAQDCPSALNHNMRMKDILLNDHLNDFLQVDNIYHNASEFPYIRQITDFTAVLPNLNKVKLAVRNSVLKSVVELEVQDALQKSGTLNWWKGTELLLLKTTSDGSCLLHATALYLWGTEDSQLQLRQYLYTVMKHDVYGQLIKRHWQYEKDHETYQLTPDQLDAEWSQIVEACSCDAKTSDQQGLPYEMLEAIHIFALSNILARPIIVLSNRNVCSLNGEALQNDTLGGIYLPLLVKPDEAFKSPILLVYNSNHFMPLISQSSPRNGVPADLQVPLVRKKLDPLKIHFLLPDQKQDEYACLRNYLWVKEELHTDDSDYCNKYLVAQLNFTKIDDSVDLLLDFVRAVRKWQHDNSPERVETGSLNKRCSTTGCTFYCAINSDKFCSLCLRKFQTTDLQGNGKESAIQYPENAQGAEGRVSRDILNKHVADLDDYLEPLVTSPSSSSQITEPSYQRSKPPASEHVDPSFGHQVEKSGLDLPTSSTSKNISPTDSTGIAQMTAQLNLKQASDVKRTSPSANVRGYGTPSPVKEMSPQVRMSPTRDRPRSNDYEARSSPIYAADRKDFTRDRDESLSLRLEQRSEGRPTDLVRSFKDPLPQYKAERSFKAEICRYPDCDRYGDENLKKMCATHYTKILNRMQMDKYSEKPKVGTSKYGYSTGYSNLDMTTSAGSSSSGISYSSKYRPALGLEMSHYDASRYARSAERESPVDKSSSVQIQPPLDRVTAYERKSGSPSPTQTRYEDPRAALLAAEPDELRSLADVEAKIKQTAKFCKLEGCNNYGNIRKIGYCNECYNKRYKRSSPS